MFLAEAPKTECVSCFLGSGNTRHAHNACCKKSFYGGGGGGGGETSYVQGDDVSILHILIV